MALMDPKAILAYLAKLLGLDADGGAGEGDVTPPEGQPTPDQIEPPADPTTPPNLDAPEGETGSEIRPTDGPTPDGENAPADPANPATEDPEGAPTHVDGETDAAELRLSLIELGTENERLRTILAENGIDFGDDEEPPTDNGDPIDGDPDDEYDDEAAEADIAEQKRQIAEWSK